MTHRSPTEEMPREEAFANGFSTAYPRDTAAYRADDRNIDYLVGAAAEESTVINIDIRTPNVSGFYIGSLVRELMPKGISGVKKYLHIVVKSSRASRTRYGYRPAGCRGTTWDRSNEEVFIELFVPPENGCRLYGFRGSEKDRKGYKGGKPLTWDGHLRWLIAHELRHAADPNSDYITSGHEIEGWADLYAMSHFRGGFNYDSYDLRVREFNNTFSRGRSDERENINVLLADAPTNVARSTAREA